ncbi:type II 3-dehydroquinate dehydratase [Rurimicrobium arvi]|uniref:3-dehydroquinate dehydratase n=1 Tax=Rurimicrobium arvi TaxID=2049916 RepID=A0ABP8MSB1_9BACT
MKIAIVNGPNLNLTGSREPQIYGRTDFDTLLSTLRSAHPDVEIVYFQSNIEGALIDFLHSCIGNTQGIILNAGAYTHTSIALADAISAVAIPCIELHLSNVFAREEYRKTSYIASKCIGSISGLGMYGYKLALAYFINAGEDAS